MTHRNWLCGVVLRRDIEGPLFLWRIVVVVFFHCSTEDVSLDLYLWGYFFFLLLVPPEESFCLHLSRSLLMVFDGAGGVLNK